MTIERTPAANLGLPTLEDVLRSFAARAFLDIELKVGGLETEMIAALREYPSQKGYVVSSFLPEVLRAVHDLDASVTLGFLSEERDELGRWRELPVAWVIPHFPLADRALIEQVHASGKKTLVWTVNRAEQMRQLAEWGVDAIISDETEVLIHSLQ